MQKNNLSSPAYETPMQEVIDIKLTGSIAVTSRPTEPIITDPEEEI